MLHYPLLFLCVVFILISCSPEVIHRYPAKEREEQRGLLLKDLENVIEVISGDSIKLQDGRIVKYIGISSPKRGEAFFTEAKKRNEQLLKWGKNKVFLEEGKRLRDEQGRYLYYVYTPTRFMPHDELICCFVNKELISHGIGLAKADYPEMRYKENFEQLEREARKNKRGFWGEDFK